MTSVSSTQMAEILHPPTYWVGRRCYRVLSSGYVGVSGSSSYNYAEEDSYSGKVLS